MKYIFVTGGVVSGLGKGICAASLGRLLKQCGLRVRNQKFDPYLNVDPGTMSPYQHGEVFVTDDGAETDLDLGHYERFVDEALDANSSVSSGKIYWSVLNRERQGGYLGGTVQIIPHVTDEIKNRIYAMDDGQTDVVISEIGGTVGDIESQPFLEAIRQVAAEKGKENVLYIHVPLIVSIPGSGELKSKPTQHSVKELLSIGIQPDILVCRTDSPITGDIRRKIALFCNVEEDCVIPNATASTLYEVPLLLEREGLCRVACRKLGLPVVEPDMARWRAMVEKIHGVHRHVTIALVGKYTGLHDAYLSVVESLFHAGTACDAEVTIRWVDSETLTPENVEQMLAGCGGVLVPGHAGNGDLFPQHIGAAHAYDLPALAHPGQGAAGDAQLLEQGVVPAQLVDVEQHGAGGVGVVGDVLPRQPPDEPRLHRAEQQLPPFRPLPGAGDVIQDPADLGAGEIGVDEQSRGGDDALLQSLPLQLLAQLRRPTALPDDGVIHRLAGGLIPNNGGLPLVGDADAGDAALRQPPDGLRRRQTLRVPDGHGVVLHPARLRIDLGKGVLGLGGDLPRPVKYDGTGAGSPLIQCQNIRCHSRLLFSFWWVCGILSIE